MDGVTALVGALLSALRPLAPDVFPGAWAWAVTLLGVGVGLLPTLGVLVVAVLRRRAGSSYGFGEGIVLAGAGLLCSGLLPLLAFSATGRLVSRVARGAGVSGLTGADLDELAAPVPYVGSFVGSQADYLGRGVVAAAFDVGDPVRLVLALVALAVLPLLCAVFVLIQGRLVLRRGPTWPSTFIWLPVLALAFLTATTPAGSSGHLWIGMTVGTFLGIVVALLLGAPSRGALARADARGARSGDPRSDRSRSDRSRSDRSRSGRPESGGPSRRPEPPSRREPRPPIEPTRSGALSDRMAQRFAARSAEPPVAPVGPVSGRPPSPPTPTLVAAAPVPMSGSVSGSMSGAPRFRLIRRLGQGGFGRVWLAHDARLGHTVALKAAHAPDAETEQRIQREARALGAVRHPHCVTIYDLVHASSDPGLAEMDGMVIVMGYVEGQSLGDLVRGSGTLDDVAAARVWASVAGALDAAHTRGVMHRDVKPGNVIVDPGGLAHLIDFGIARRTGDATMTVAGFVLGTPDFLAPEVAGGQKATPASDAWQLAATVSYALTGQPPRGGHQDAISGLRAAAAGAPLKHLPPRSAHLALLRAAMDNDPARRPPLSVARQALEDWLRRQNARLDGPVTVVHTRR